MQFIPGRSHSSASTIRPSHVAQGSKEYAGSNKELPLIPVEARRGLLSRRGDPDTASITAVKSREMLRNQTGSLFEDNPEGNSISPVDEMVITSLGGGRKACLIALLQAQTTLNSRGQPSSSNQGHINTGINTIRPASTPVSGRRRLRAEAGSDTSERETPRTSEFPLPIVPSWKDHHSQETTGDIDTSNFRLPSTGPLVIRKRRAIQNPNGNSLYGITNAAVETLRRSDATRTIHQFEQRPSANVRNRGDSIAVDELLDEMLTSGIKYSFRATKCPSGIKGDPLNRI
jgi:hypothetical protein